MKYTIFILCILLFNSLHISAQSTIFQCPSYLQSSIDKQYCLCSSSSSSNSTSLPTLTSTTLLTNPLFDIPIHSNTTNEWYFSPNSSIIQLFNTNITDTNSTNTTAVTGILYFNDTDSFHSINSITQLVTNITINQS